MAQIQWQNAPNESEQLAQTKHAALARINAEYSEMAKPLIESYPREERESWQEQKSEAMAYQSWLDGGEEDHAPATPVLDAILEGRNNGDGTETMPDLVARVLKNVSAFIEFQKMTGKRHRLERLIDEAGTIEEVDAVTW